jgi:D-glycerate 3-kinase
MDTKLSNLITELELPDEFNDYITNFLAPIAAGIDNLSHTKSTPIIGINGSQGSGKSTAAAILQVILETKYNHRVAVLSIDDFYHTKAKRVELSQSLHPLFITRGVPGTHNIQLAIKTLKCLKNALKGEQVAIPRFDKTIDDIKPQQHWEKIQAPVSIIIFEGWCIAAPAIENNALIEPLNHLEEQNDNKAIWRKTYNQFLKDQYQILFSHIDWLLMLKAPNFDVVYQWRLLQEQKLAKMHANTDLELLSKPQLQYFIEHYQRLTEHCLLTVPKIANAIISLNKEHKMTDLQIKK